MRTSVGSRRSTDTPVSSADQPAGPLPWRSNRVASHGVRENRQSSCVHSCVCGVLSYDLRHGHAHSHRNGCRHSWIIATARRRSCRSRRSAEPRHERASTGGPSRRRGPRDARLDKGRSPEPLASHRRRRPSCEGPELRAAEGACQPSIDAPCASTAVAVARSVAADRRPGTGSRHQGTGWRHRGEP